MRNHVHKTLYAIKLELFNLSEVYLLMTSKRSTLDLGPSSLSLGSGSTTLGSGGDRKGRRPDIESWDAANTFAGTATVESNRAGGGSGADSADRSSTAGTQSPESCSSAVADGERCHSPG